MAAGMLAAFFLTAVALVYWAVVRAPVLAERGDNPRAVEAELRIRRGRILDADGVVLAETVGTAQAPLRLYTIPSIGPAVGYYSFRHGTAGIEQGYDDVLRGDSAGTWDAFWRRTLDEPQIGQDIRLTLDAELQRATEELMAGKRGAVLLLSLPDGGVKVMVSHPGYDPNRLDELFEELVQAQQGPLLNRATQGQYQPGLLLQPFILASAVEQELLQLNETTVNASSSIVVRNQLKTCRETPPDDATWHTALAFACPAPMMDLADEIAPGDLAAAFDRFGFYTQPEFPMATAPTVTQPITDVEDAILGQGVLTVTPLQLVRAWAALGNGGVLPTPYLVSAVQNSAGVWQNAEAPEAELAAVSPGSADAVLAALGRYEGTIAEHSTTVLSGPQETMNGWYLGLMPAQSPRYAVVVVVEEAADASSAQQIGRSVLQAAMAPD